MKDAVKVSLPPSPAPVYVVSGGSGSSGELLVHTAVAQFVGRHVPLVLVPRVRLVRQLTAVIARAEADGGMVVHTLVNPKLRAELTRRGEARGVVTLDLMGPLLTHLSTQLGQPPKGQPGLYRQMQEAYFKRVAAVDFAMHHDDGLRPEDLPEAEIVLLGVSRIGKTPLTMYLAILGWKVANIPLVAGMELPGELRRVNRRRVIGLTIEPRQLALHRASRQEQERNTLPASYTSQVHLRDELDRANELYRDRGFAAVDVTQKPIESTAEEILNLIGDR